MAISFFKENRDNHLNPKDQMKKIQSLGIQMHKNKVIERKEALSKLYYKNALDVFLSNGFKKIEEQDHITTFTKQIEDYLNVIRA